MKKKILLIITGILLLTSGCMSSNTPTSKVEALFNKYNSNDEAIVTELRDYLKGYNLDDDTNKKYEKIYLKQFSDLTYEIKEEEVDGDEAEVTVQISVYDYYKSERESNNYLMDNKEKFYTNDVYDKTLFENYKLEQLEKVTDRIDYTLEFELTRIDDEWQIDALSDEQLQKIHGIYAYE